MPDVKAIPPTGAKWQVSVAGGNQPRWRRDGKELYYISADRKLMAVAVKTGGTSFEAGAQQPLIENVPFVAPFGWISYQPSDDGQRSLGLVPAGGESAAPPITVVLNWQAGLKK